LLQWYYYTYGNGEVTRKYLDIPLFPLYNQECCLEVIDMKWSINQLQRYRQGDMPFDETVNLDSVKKRNPEIRDIKPIHVTGSCTIGSSNLTCRFRLEGMLTLPCARTWEDVAFPFLIESTERFSWDETELAADDEIHQVSGDFVDLTPVFEELVLLEVPLQVFSKDADDVKTAEGKGWSYATDEAYNARLQEERETKVDPRLAGLANLFEKKDE
jgi:uncharacterized protein